TGAPDRNSSHGHRGPGRSRSADSRSADTALKVPSCAPAPARPAPPSPIDTATPTVRPQSAFKPAAATDSRPSRTPRPSGGAARSPFFCGDLFHHLELKIPLGHELLQPGVLMLQLLQAPYIIRLKHTEALAPSVDRLL